MPLQDLVLDGDSHAVVSSLCPVSNDFQDFKASLSLPQHVESTYHALAEVCPYAELAIARNRLVDESGVQICSNLAVQLFMGTPCISHVADSIIQRFSAGSAHTVRSTSTWAHH